MTALPLTTAYLLKILNHICMNAKDRPAILLAIAALCILATSFLPLFFKTLFVEETGNIKVISPWLTALLFLAYVYRKSWLRKVTLIVCSVAAIMLIVIIGTGGFKDNKAIGLSFLLLFQVVTILILMNKEVKTFLSRA